MAGPPYPLSDGPYEDLKLTGTPCRIASRSQMELQIEPPLAHRTQPVVLQGVAILQILKRGWIVRCRTALVHDSPGVEFPVGHSESGHNLGVGA